VGDYPTALRALEAVINAGRLTPAEQQPMLQNMTAMAERGGDHAGAIRWAQRYFQAGGTSPAVRLNLIQALFSSGDLAATQKELLPLVQADEAAGRKPPLAQLQLLGNCQLKLNDDAGYLRTLERLVTHYPAAEYWADLVPRLQRKPGFNDRLLLDSLRLMRHAGALEDADDFVELAQLALKAGQPGEAQAVVDEGFAKGVLGKGSSAASHQKLQATARKQAADDQAQFTASEAQARKAGDGAALVSLGQALVTANQVDKGLALMTDGLAKGVARQPQDARLRLGVALLTHGHRDQALPLLQGLQGNDGAADLGRLWLLHLP
jgi:tetratricopeptide (TPR) repeat protein